LTWKPDIVIYHDKCIDGFTAAWCCWRQWPEAEYIARNYGMGPGLDYPRGKHVLIVDFSFPQAMLEELVWRHGVASIVILDHHKTAEAALEPFRFRESSPGTIAPGDIPGMLRDLNELNGRPPIIALFDMERSGAGMAWDFTNGRQTARPGLIDLVEARDLWRPDRGDAADHLHLALSSGRKTFERWDAAAEGLWNFVHIGAQIAAYRDSLIEEIMDRAWMTEIDGLPAVTVDCPYLLVSETGHRLLERFPDAAFAALRVAGQHSVTFSLRSEDSREDVSALASKFGGGGHRNAAGFRVPA
jgi:oligoribonuclease NrnB/cAMP/cGMP phosphodiesterase (DHH superfamily)